MLRLQNVFQYDPLKKRRFCGSIGNDLSICKYAHRGRIVYIEISPHPAKARIIWELLLLYFRPFFLMYAPLY